MTINADNIYLAIVQGSQDGVLVSDGDEKIVESNHALCKLIGRTEAEINGQPLASVIDLEALKAQPAKPISSNNGHGQSPSTADDTKEDSNGNSKCASAEEHHPLNVNIFCRTGMELTMPVSYIPIKNKEGATVGHLTIVYIVQASSVQQAQTEFVSTVSHELRTPLTSIKGFADTILRAGDRLDLAQQRRYIGIIKDQADRLGRLVEDLLAVSRLESKKMQLTIRAIDLGAAVQRVLRNLTDKGANHRLVTNVPTGLTPVWADSDRIEQILTNLIDNAIKYSPAKTTVTINAREVATAPPMVEFSVSDQGVGIASEHLSEIFTKFSRLDNPLVRQTEGTGLGLYITRSLVLALGGQITVTSSPGNTTFTVQLPAATLEEQAARGRG